MTDPKAPLTLAGQPNQWAGSGPVWCPIATVSVHRSGVADESDGHQGTKHFAPGTKVYLRHILGYHNARDDQPVVEVVGRHRRTHRYARLALRNAWVEYWEVDLVYSPTVIRLLWPKWDGTADSKATAEEYVRTLATTSTDAPEHG